MMSLSSAQKAAILAVSVATFLTVAAMVYSKADKKDVATTSQELIKDATALITQSAIASLSAVFVAATTVTFTLAWPLFSIKKACDRCEDNELEGYGRLRDRPRVSLV